jgi:hypothetical protein
MFKFRYSVKPENLWVLTMVNFYRSFLGVCNLVFTVSMIMLAVRFWSGSSMGIRILISVGILLFPVFQPLMIYLRCRRIVDRMPGEIEISFDKTGITTSANGESSFVNFSEVKSIVTIFNLMIIRTRSKQGFILSDRVLGNQSKSLYNFIKANVVERGKE